MIGTTGGEPRQIVSSVRAHSPRFSPDGRLVTYWTGPPVWNIPGASRASGTQFVISATGGPSRPIAPQLANAWYGTWSPDGSKILLIGESRRAPNDSTVDWYIVDVDGGEPTRTGAVEALKQAGVKGVPVPAAWTNDGLVFANYDQGASNVWQIAVSPSGRITGRPERLTFGTAIERSPSVNAAGRLAFSSVVEDVDVWRIPLDPKSGV